MYTVSSEEAKTSRFLLWYAGLGLAVEPILYWLFLRIDSTKIDWIILILWPSFITTIDVFPRNKSEEAATWFWICILNPFIYSLAGLFLRRIFLRFVGLRKCWDKRIIEK